MNLSSRTASYFAALERDGDAFDRGKWLREVMKTVKRGKARIG